MDIKAYLNGKEELPTDPEELKALIGAARTELSALCKGKQWCMCIPVEPTDSDIAIMLGLSAGLKALEEVEDWREGTRRVMAEECAPDEKHCTCVPTLRKEIERLKAEIEDLKASLEIEKDCTQSWKNVTRFREQERQKLENVLGVIAQDHMKLAEFAATNDWHGAFNWAQDLAKKALYHEGDVAQ